MDIEGIVVESLGKRIEIPRVWISCSNRWFESNSSEDGMLKWDYGFHHDYKEYRLLTLAEIFDIIGRGFREPMKNEACANMLLPFFIYHEMEPVFTNVGYSMRDQKITVYKNYCTRENVKNVKPGMPLEDQNLDFEKETFDIERLFRKYNPDCCTLRELDKANPDLTEYLFGQEYEDLPELLRDITKIEFGIRGASGLGMNQMCFYFRYEHPARESIIGKQFFTNKMIPSISLSGLCSGMKIKSYWLAHDLDSKKENSKEKK